MCGPRFLSVASPPSPPPGALSPPSHCRPIAQAREELWAAAGLRAAPTVAQQPQGLFSPRRRLPLYHLVAHEQCELFLRLRPALLDAVSRSRCVHVSLSRSPRCAHVRARTAPGSARVWSARGCPGALGAWCTALEASAPQSLRSKPPPPSLRLQAFRPDLRASSLQPRPAGPMYASCVVATLSALHRDPILLAGQAPPLRVELKVDRLGRLVLRAALRAALLGRRLRCRHFHADDLLLADV